MHEEFFGGDGDEDDSGMGMHFHVFFGVVFCVFWDSVHPGADEDGGW